MTMFARLKRFNGRTHVLRSYTVFGIKFQESKGWYRVDDDVAEYLRTVKQTQEGADAEYSAPGFDVCTEDEALRIDEDEVKQEERRKAQQANEAQRRTVQDATRRRGTGDLTTADLAQPPRQRPSPSFNDLSGEFPDDGAPIHTGGAAVPAAVLDEAELDTDDEPTAVRGEPAQPAPTPSKEQAPGRSRRR